MLLPPDEVVTRRLHHELETTIRSVNQELISASTGTITRGAFTDVAAPRVGRNYHAHAIEMGRPVDKSTMKPSYFLKSATALVQSGATVPYPCGTSNYHYEMELVLAIGKPGFRVSADQAHEVVYGYACGLDMTRRHQSEEELQRYQFDLETLIDQRTSELAQARKNLAHDHKKYRHQNHRKKSGRQHATDQMSSINLTHHFLIAMPRMADPHFSRTLTYVCEHNERRSERAHV